MLLITFQVPVKYSQEFEISFIKFRKISPDSPTSYCVRFPLMWSGLKGPSGEEETGFVPI